MPLDVYFISGLGSDKRIFENIQLSGKWNIHHIHWIEPETNEDFYHYCKRLSTQIKQNSSIVLIGMSLGGMAAIELNKLFKPLKTIIISSVSSEKEFSFLFRLIRRSAIYKFIPLWMLRIPNPIAYYFFGTHTIREKELLKSFMKNVSNNYLRWSMGIVLNWKNNKRPDNLVHIHGTNDKIFPSKRSFADIKIIGGEHLMVYSKAKEISQIINELLFEIENH